MCANYVPVTSLDRLLQYFGVVRNRDEPERDLFPMGMGPFIRLALPGTGPGDWPRLVGDAIFRFVPDFIVRVDDGHGEDDLLNLVVEIKGFRGEDVKVKKETMDEWHLHKPHDVEVRGVSN